MCEKVTKGRSGAGTWGTSEHEKRWARISPLRETSQWTMREEDEVLKGATVDGRQMGAGSRAQETRRRGAEGGVNRPDKEERNGGSQRAEGTEEDGWSFE